MVTREHEAPIELLTESPDLLKDLMAHVGLPWDPAAGVEYASERCTQLNPAELRVDKVAKVTFPDGTDLMVAIEVQRKVDPRKKFTWPVYATDIRRQMVAPIALIVWCPTTAVANWAGEPISLGPSGSITPTAVSPGDFPVITSPENWTGNIGLAILAALAHQGHERFDEIAAALLELLDRIEQAKAAKYYEDLADTLNFSAFTILERTMTTMTYKFKSDFIRRHRAEAEADGELRGEATALIWLLGDRGFELGDDLVEEIRNTADEEQFRTWIRRAVTAESLDEVFAEHRRD
ncbi:hypothetical protein AB0I28_05355 [Phytomonospora sp. NPDC050363]|uniref:hypothetical protein n=1 Tax=Phytomonospora sp. NPDC050363 TaxID=3155642 RepID=UPI0033D5040F